MSSAGSSSQAQTVGFHIAQQWPPNFKGSRNKASHRQTPEHTYLNPGKDMCLTTEQTINCYTALWLFTVTAVFCAGFPDGLPAGPLPTDRPHQR